MKRGLTVLPWRWPDPGRHDRFEIEAKHHPRKPSQRDANLRIGGTGHSFSGMEFIEGVRSTAASASKPLPSRRLPAWLADSPTRSRRDRQGNRNRDISPAPNIMPRLAAREVLDFVPCK